MPAAAKQNRQPGPARSQLELHQLRLHLRSARPPAPAAAWPAGGPPPRPAPRSGRSMPSSAWPQRPAPGRAGMQGRVGTADGRTGAGCPWPFGKAAPLLAGTFKPIGWAASRTYPQLVGGRTLTSQSLRAAWSVPSASLGCHSSSCCSAMLPAALAGRCRHALSKLLQLHGGGNHAGRVGRRRRCSAEIRQARGMQHRLPDTITRQTQVTAGCTGAPMDK